MLALGGLAYALLQSLVAPALPEIQHSLHTSTTAATWVLTSYLLSASVSTPILGRMGDIFGKERMLVVSLGLLAGGTLVSALSHSIGLLIAGRVVQGFGGAIFPLAFGIIRDEFPRERVASGIGLISSILGIGAGAGIVLAGVIVDNLSYRWLFWIPLVLIVIATVSAHWFVPESPVRTPARINWLAAALLTTGLSALLVSMSEAPTWGWLSGRFIALTLASLAVLAAWVWVEVRAREPLIDMRMMRLRGVWTTNAAAWLIGFGMYSSFILVPQLVELPKSTGFGFGGSVTQAGLYLLPSTLAMLLIGPLAGTFDRRFGSRLPLILGAAFATAAFVMLAVAHGSPWEIYTATGLLGVGIGFAFASMANLIVAAVPQSQTGAATGMNTIMRNIGGAFGSQVIASVLAADIAGGSPTDRSFTLSFVIAAAVLVAGIGASLAVPRRLAVGTQDAAAPPPRQLAAEAA